MLVKLSGGRIVEATIKALVDTTEGMFACKWTLGTTKLPSFSSGRSFKRVVDRVDSFLRN